MLELVHDATWALFTYYYRATFYHFNVTKPETFKENPIRIDAILVAFPTVYRHFQGTVFFRIFLWQLAASDVIIFQARDEQ